MKMFRENCSEQTFRSFCALPKARRVLHTVMVVSRSSTKSNRETDRRHICPSWVTDMLHMTDCKKLLIGTTNRILHFYDISAATHMEEFRVYGLPNIAHCFAYWFDDKDDADDTSLLFFGDDAGNVHILQFEQPDTQLFKKTNMEGLIRVFFLDLDHHREYVSYRCLEKVHDDVIRHIRYLPHNCSIITCSDDREAPLIIQDIQGKLKAYIFKVSKGIYCFDFYRPLNLLVTGSGDSLVRFWNPYVPDQPVAILKGHRVVVIDVKIISLRHIVVSYSRDMVLKTWNIAEYNCLQTLHLKFPILSQPDAEREHGPSPLHLETPAGKSVLVTCKDYVTELKLSEEIDDDDHITLPERLKPTASPQVEIRESEEAILIRAISTPPKPQIKPKPVLRQAEALDEFATYIFAKLRDYDGHMTRSEMKSAVLQGTPFRALKVTNLDEVYIEPNLPMSERMKKKGFAYASESDLLALNLNFIGGSIIDGRLSRRSSMASNYSQRQGGTGLLLPVKGRLRLPTLLPSIQKNSSRPSSRASSVCSNSDYLLKPPS